MTPALLLLGAVLLLGGIGGLVIFAVLGAGRFRRNRSAPLPPPAPGESFALGGRRFRRLATGSIAQHEYVHDVLLAAGIAEPELLPGEGPQDYVERIFTAMHGAKMDRPLVAAAIVPVEAPRWNPEVAAEVAQFLGTLEEERDQRIYYALLGDLLRPFCVRGLPSWLRSRTSGPSGPTTTQEPGPVPLATSQAAAAAAGRI